MKKIAVTGGLAAGKSSVCHYLQELGAYTVSADDIVHQILSPLNKIGKQITEVFGQEIIKDEFFDREKIALIAFANRDKLQKLEEILHPPVFEEIQRQYHYLLTHNPPSLFVSEIPLLFETSSERYFDEVVVIVSAEAEACQRFVDLSGQSSEQYFLRTSRLLPIEDKVEKASFVLYNDGSKEKLNKQVRTLFELLVIQ